MGALAIITIISAVLPYVPALIKDAEEIFGSGTGEQKKKYVVVALTSAAEGSLSGLGAGGIAPEVVPILQKFAPSFEKIVDMAVAGMNAGSALPKAVAKIEPTGAEAEQVPVLGAGV